MAPSTSPGPAGPPRAERALSWPLLAALAALPSAAAWAAGKSLAFRDTATLYAPTRGLVTAALREGRLPLWNPHEGIGQPLFAQGIHGVLHPLSLLAALLDPGGVDLLVALYLVAAALGAFALARVLGLERPHAFVAGAAYGLSGFVVSMTGNLVFLAGAASLPWQVAALAAAGRGARRAVPLAALATAVTLFSGDAQQALLAALLGGALAVEAGGWRGGARAAAATGLGALLAAVQLLPTLAAIDLSARSAGLHGLERSLLALSPWRLPELLLPGLFVRFDGPADPELFRWLGGPTAPGIDLPFATSIHLGVPALALAACVPLRDRTVRLLGGAAALALWLALGHFAGASQLLGRLPLWGLFRYTEKLVAPLSLALALLAAFGARGDGGTGPDRRRLLVAAGACAAIALVTLLVGSALGGAPPPAGELLLANLRGGLPYALAGALAVALSTLLPPGGALRGAALAACVAASQLAALPFATLPVPREPCHTWPGALVAEPPGPRLTVPFVGAAIPHIGFARREPSLAEVTIADACARGRMGAPSRNVRDGIDGFGTYGGLGSRRMALLARAIHDLDARAAPWFSATHAAVLLPMDAELAATQAAATAGGALVADDAEYPIELYAIPHVPWARFPPSVAIAPGPEAAAAAFASAVAAGRDAAVVEAQVPVPAGRGAVLSVSRRPERLAVEVDVAAEGLLAVNDAFWPGWTARVDGREAPILATNVLARGVVVPAGRHVVTMEYAPRELRAGIVLSVLGLVACVVLAAPLPRRAAQG